MTEEQAVRLCLADRDPIGFEFLVRKYQREAFVHALALLRNRDDAAEACQESFARAFASLPRLSELTAFYPWFYRILRNCCLNMLDRRRTASNYARSVSPDVDEGPEPGPEALMSRGEESERVLATLSSLRLEFREILALKYLRGYDYETLAAILSIPRGTVMSRLFHARKAFQAAYLEHEKRGAAEEPAL
ncbi:MAG TPA: sigma-70 family RNA polymerase sigma factor, partial [Gammaproteobacteria bacterium]|nr:sigma-70 family RNA polymerase sigma factor [Gammaproteobacteria bacterium]